MPVAIETKVQSILDEAQIKYFVFYQGETTRDNNWQCDEWVIQFEKQTRANPAKPYLSEKFEYFTGLGNRHPVAPISARAQKGLNPRCIAWHDIEKTRKPKPPHAASVIYSLLADSDAGTSTFNEWCDNYGFDSDSINALKTYHACQENSDKLKRLFTSPQIQSLQEALQDY